jgi:uncharacterized protein YecA (UPF0149 family)
MAMGDRKLTERFDRRREKQDQIKAGLPGADEPPLPPPVDTIHGDEKEIGRNDPCPCGSGKKYKKCCGNGK